MDRSSTRAVAFQIGLATFGILALELALIRWTSQQVPVFAYFNNLTLLAAFLGMGLGVALGTRRPELQSSYKTGLGGRLRRQRPIDGDRACLTTT